MRHKMAFSLVTGVLLVTMAVLTALAERDYTLGTGTVQAHLLGTLDIPAVANPKNVNINSLAGGVMSVPLAGKIAPYLMKGDGVGLWGEHKADSRAESRPPDSGTDPFIVGAPGEPGAQTDFSV